MATADDRYAKITREQYDNWLTQYYPEQKKLLEQTQNGSLMKEQLSRVEGNFSSARLASQTGIDNQKSRYGLSATQTSTSDENRLSLAKVASKNNVRDYERDRSLATLSGASLNKMQPQKV